MHVYGHLRTSMSDRVTAFKEGRMTERVDPELNRIDASREICRITDYCQKNDLSASDEYNLKQLFGEFATAGEIAMNRTRLYRGR